MSSCVLFINTVVTAVLLLLLYYLLYCSSSYHYFLYFSSSFKCVSQCNPSTQIDERMRKGRTALTTMSTYAVYKIILIGDAGVGKTTCLPSIRNINGGAPKPTKPTMGVGLNRSISRLKGGKENQGSNMGHSWARTLSGHY